MEKPIFKDQRLQEQFEEDGYVLVKNVLSPTQVKYLRDLYLKLEQKHYGNKIGMHSTSHTSDVEMLEIINREFRETVGETVDKYLTNYKISLGNFLVKEGREDSLFDMHQDWTVVDEPKYCSMNFWMDLTGCNRKNGYMFYLKGTHRLLPTLRFSPQCPTPFEKIRHIAPYFYTYTETNPGDVVFLNNATIHGSTVNYSDKSRIVGVLGVYSGDADFLHYYHEPGASLDKIEKYIVETKSMIHMPRGQRPPFSTFAGYVTYNPVQIEPNDFIRFMLKNTSWKDKGNFLLRKLGVAV